MKAMDEHSQPVVFFALFLGTLALYSVLVPVYNIGDGFSIYVAVTKLVQDGNLNFWGAYNDTYVSPFFSYTYHDIVIKDMGEIYPIQFVGSILIYSMAFLLGGSTLFYMVSPIAGALTVAGLHLLSLDVFGSRVKAILPPLILALSPIFVIWSVFPGNAAISTMFFIYSVLFSLRVSRTPSAANMLGFSLSCALLILTRYPHGLLAVALISVPLLVTVSGRLGVRTKLTNKHLLLIFLLPLLIALSALLILNYVWFGDPLFMAYFMKNNVPLLGDGAPLGGETYFWNLLSLERLPSILSYCATYFVGSNVFVSFFALSWLGLLMGAAKFRVNGVEFCEAKRIIILQFFISWVLLAIYYGAASNVFWFSTISPTAPHFRYMLPTYALLPIFSIFLLEPLYEVVRKLRGSDSKWAFLTAPNHRRKTGALVVGILVLSSGFISYNYAQLWWIEDVDSSMNLYQTAAESIPENSVILYGSRWSLLILLPVVDEFVWFYYIGIPEAYRENETVRTVELLIADNESVLFFSSRYDSPQETAMLDILSSAFQFTYLNDTYFERLDAVFYSISTKQQ